MPGVSQAGLDHTPQSSFILPAYGICFLIWTATCLGTFISAVFVFPARFLQLKVVSPTPALDLPESHYTLSQSSWTASHAIVGVSISVSLQPTKALFDGSNYCVACVPGFRGAENVQMSMIAILYISDSTDHFYICLGTRHLACFLSSSCSTVFADVCELHAFPTRPCEHHAHIHK